MTDDYEYRGLIARAWDLLRGDYASWPDRPYYRAIIESQGGPALDVGCGTGRLLLDYLAAGLDVDGADNSPEMLAICRDKAIGLTLDVATRLFEQDMASLELPRRYATIIVPSSSFQLLTDPAAAADAMRLFFAHLVPGGVLVMSFMSQLWPGKAVPPQMQWSAWYRVAEQEQPDGSTVRRWARARYDDGQQLEHEENRYEVLERGEVVLTESYERSPATRWYTQAQAAGAYAAGGFADIRLTRAFTDEPPTPDDRMFCVLGTRP